MGFAIKYRTEFQDITESGSNLGVIWKTEFLENNATSVTTLMSTSAPLVKSYDNNSDSVFDPIRESHVEVSVYSDTNFALQDLYSVDFMQFKVNIYADDVLQWTGYIDPQRYSEPYEPPSYPVTISCTDGLSLLKDFEYLNGSVHYLGRRYESQVLLDVLGKIGYTEFKEYVNLYEDTMDNTVDDSPCDQLLIDVYTFRDFNCYDVLTELLKKYNAFIRQKDGIFCIVRPKELTAVTVYGRYFTAYNTKTSITLLPEQLINRIGHITSRWQVPGGELMIQPPIKEVIITHDYGNRESWILNYNFEGSTLSGNILTGYVFEDWVNMGTPAIDVLGKVATGEGEGVVIPYNVSPGSNYIYQNFGPNSLYSANDYFALEFDWMFWNTTSATESVQIRITVRAVDADYWLNEINEEHCQWENTSYDIIIIEDAIVGQTGWMTWKRIFSGLPSTGGYRIAIFPLYGSLPGIYLGIKNVRFYCSSAETIKKIIGQRPVLKKKFLTFTTFWQTKNPYWKFENAWGITQEAKTLTGKEYYSYNSINGVVASDNCLLGDVVDDDLDNIPNQFAGSLACNGGTPIAKIDIIRLTGSSGTMNIICNGLSRLATYQHPLAVAASNFVDDWASEYLNLADIIVTSDGITLSFEGVNVGEDFTTYVEQITGNLNGTVTEGSVVTYALTNTKTWSTRSGNESLTLLQLIADEIALMYYRPKQLVQMPIMETAKGMQINVLGNFKDTVNLYGGAVRTFVMNRGTFDARNREWNLDLFELGAGNVVEQTEVKYGFLYNWFATTDARNIANTGWHLPSYAEFVTLGTFLGGDFDNLGGLLKETGLTYWNTPNTGAINSLGFNLRGAGVRDIDGSFINIKGDLYLWITDIGSGTDGISFGAFYFDATFYGYQQEKNHGWSIRLIKDDSTLEDYIGNDGRIYNTVKIGTQVWLSENLVETLYRNLDEIPYVSDNSAWAALITGAYCYYDNNIDNVFTTTSEFVYATADSTLVTADDTTHTVDEI